LIGRLNAGIAPFAVEAAKESVMEVDRRKFLLLGGTGLVALGTAKMAAAELPSLLRGEAFSPAPANAIFARAFNLWMDQAVRYEQQWSHEAEDVAAFRRQSALGIEPRYGVRASANLLQFLEQAQVAA
jgi:hypothetical protein